MKTITEDKIETFAIYLLRSVGRKYIPGLAIAPGAEQVKRVNHLRSRLYGCSRCQVQF